MTTYWLRIHAYLERKAPEILADLRPGASTRAIELLEQKLQIRLPNDFAACLKVHNGQTDNAAGLFNGLTFLGTEAIAQEWDIWQRLLLEGDLPSGPKPEAGISLRWWDCGWVPFTSNGSGDHLCIDLNPGTGGTYGQVISIWHDDARRTLKAHSFEKWISDFAKQLA